MPSKAERRKRKILDCAVKLFGAHGHAATTMSDIVAEIGGSKATLYKYFASKDALFQAVLELYANGNFGSLDALLDGNGPIRARVQAFAREFLLHLVQPRMIDLRRLLAFEAQRSDLGRQIHEKTIVPTWRLIAHSLEREMKGRALRRADPWQAALHLRALIEGHIPMFLDTKAIDRPSRRELLKAADAAADVFMRAYAPDGAAVRQRVAAAKRVRKYS